MAIEISDLNSLQDEEIILDGLMNIPLIKGDKGETGEQGLPNQLTIGTVESGEEASATIEGEAPNQTLNLILPKGDKGDTGASGADGECYDDTEIREIISNKIDKVEGMGLSANDFSDELKQKLDDIGEGSFLPTGGTTGQVLAKASDNDGDVEWVDQSAGSTTVENVLPIGSVVEWYSDTIPQNWLICNGQAVSRSDYADLFSVLGTNYGTGNGSTTFNVPNLQGRVPVGKSSNDTDFNALGKKGGEKKHILSIDEIPSHVHEINIASDTGNRTDGYVNANSYNLATQKGSTLFMGGGESHNNLQPYTVCNFIIKAKQSKGTSESVTKEYSTEERKIGKWINGKNLYEKVIETTTPVVTTNGTSVWRQVAIPNVDFGMVVNAQAQLSSNKLNSILCNVSGNNRISSNFVVNNSNGILEIVSNCTDYNNKYAFAIVQYTKVNE